MLKNQLSCLPCIRKDTTNRCVMLTHNSDIDCPRTVTFAIFISLNHCPTFHQGGTRIRHKFESGVGRRSRLFHAIKVPFVLRRTRRILIVAVEVNSGWLCQYDLISCARCFRTLVRTVTLKSHVWTLWTTATCYTVIVILLNIAGWSHVANLITWFQSSGVDIQAAHPLRGKFLHMISQWFIRKTCWIVFYSQAIRGDQKRNGFAQYLFYFFFKW